jgi:hypothetical protein
MANLKISNTLRSNMMDEITSYAGTSATIKLYSGTQPSGGGAATTLLVTLTCDATAFAGAASNGVLTLNSVTGGTAVATGTATWFRIATSGGTFVLDGDVGLQSAGVADLQLDDVSIVTNGSVSLSGPNVLTAGNAP